MSIEKYSTEERIIAPYHHIDPGLINYRLIFSTFGRSFRERFELNRKKSEAHFSKLYNDHLLVDMVLEIC
jgi:hypothetical protein